MIDFCNNFESQPINELIKCTSPVENEH